MTMIQAAALRPFSQLFLRTTASSPMTILQNAPSSWAFRHLVPTTVILPAITISLPGILSDIWEGVLRAVPKKKTSHMKKRHRQLAGKALKDVKSVNTCPGCGKPKLAHNLCPYCVAEIQQSWKNQAEEGKTAEAF